MAGPLHPVPFYDPGAGGGDPWLHAVGNSLLNVLTLGEHKHPGSLNAYGRSVAASLNPMTPEGALNLATILVPGNRRGAATWEQAKFLQSINESSHGATPAQGWDLSFARDDPGVQALMKHLGAPKMGYVARNQALARPPWVGLDKRVFQQLHGGAGGRRMSNAFAGELPIGDAAAHQGWLTYLINKNAIQRRN